MKCDHIIGIQWFPYGGGWAVHKSDTYPSSSHDIDYFKFCPKCGEKLEVKD